jgi:hypothetical protein
LVSLFSMISCSSSYSVSASLPRSLRIFGPPHV